MADELTTTGAPKELSLDKLTRWLRGQEASLGPVIAIGNNGAATAATFRFDLLEPQKRASILLKSNAASANAAWEEICEGEVFIEGQLEDVVVFRES